MMIKQTKSRNKRLRDVGEISSPQVCPLPAPDPLLSNKNFPARWDAFKDRPLVYERYFDIEDIYSSSEFGAIQLPGVIEFVTQRNWKPYLQPKDKGYASLTRLFYASMACNLKDKNFTVRIGEFKATISIVLLTEVFGTAVGDIMNATYHWSEEPKGLPDLEEMVRDLFLTPVKHKHQLRQHIHILLHTFAHSNLLPSKGNKETVTEDMIQLLYVMVHHKSVLAHAIFYRMCEIGNKKSGTLPFPCLITTLLTRLGYVMPANTSEGCYAAVYKARDWDKSLNFGASARRQGFTSTQIPITLGLVVGGQPIEGPLSVSTRASTSKTQPQPISSSTSVDNLATLVENMGIEHRRRFDELKRDLSELKEDNLRTLRVMQHICDHFKIKYSENEATDGDDNDEAEEENDLI